MSDAQAVNPLKRAVEETPVEPIPDTKKPKSGDPSNQMEVEDDEEEDELAGIDEKNIIIGSRTRGKKIDFTKAIEVEGDDDDEEDEDVVVGDETMALDDEGEETNEEEEDEDEETEDQAA
ncbi:hypothetical protein O181_021781 [Austropuccinia psidii MF-1]|uniref:Histone chaperone domain-containing protein n=1 Tax=Austropuccinia psidii MF-1 TaxID=1389203 RepID=A0A9Q3GW33_9BASI|nr:hypothetical protein [Austropuccinia psidii MF-1]